MSYAAGGPGAGIAAKTNAVMPPTPQGLIAVGRKEDA